MAIDESWAAGQLPEFLAALVGPETSKKLFQEAVERAAMAVGSEVAAIVIEGEVAASIGFPRNRVPEPQLVELASARRGRAELPGLGPCETASAPLEPSIEGSLILARIGSEPFVRAELSLVRGMGRILSLAIRSVQLLEGERELRERSQLADQEKARLLEELRERQGLLERLSRAQRTISARNALETMFGAIVDGTADLLGESSRVGLMLIERGRPDRMTLASTHGLPKYAPKEADALPVAAGLARRAIVSGELASLDHDTAHGEREVLGIPGIRVAMAAPIFERGEAAGALVVATTDPGQSYGSVEREALMAFAEHSGLAISEARSAAEIRYQARHDLLTGLPNRSSFLEHLQVRLRGEGSESVAVLFADLDGFKTINDSLGHEAGDELLILVGERLSEQADAGDVVARFGGDEFAILLADVSGEEAAVAGGRRLIAELERPFHLRGREVMISASVGIALGSGTAQELLRNVDLAMYRAKDAGKGRHQLFEPGFHRAVVEQLELEVDLKRAIERDEFVLHYQPMCEVSTGRILGLEALLRWDHPRRGMLGPHVFVPLAEASGHIVEIGEWVLDQAVAQLARWQAGSPECADLKVSVNVSGVQLDRTDPRELVAEVLARHGVASTQLVLEITESALVRDLETNVEKLSAVRELGVRVAVDDFGTGYSSLEYLSRSPLDALKMAMPFVAEITEENEAPALARAILDIGRNLGLRVVAEGVEQPAQRAALGRLGCEVGQGFHFSRPVEAAALDGLLSDRNGVGLPGGRPVVPAATDS